ncbi:MAG: ABC transporter permease [Mollicutes bacterium]|nr:ABC transporter permease [Mollicutes bacterium]MDY5875134.1 ABC transporter permease [Bacilli bacterium]
MNVFKEIYNYRELLKTNIKKEIRGKYKGSWLGVLWTFLNPLLMLAVYAFVFPYILRVNVDNYTIFMIVALIPWNFFTTAIQSGTGSVVANGNILKKVYFPREIIPISITTSQSVNFLITCIIMAVFIIFSGVGFSVHALLFPLLVLIQYILILGLTFILSALTVFVRDIDHFVSVILMLGFYATPIVYQGEMLPKKFQIFLKLNPMAQLVEAYRSILYYHRMPDMTMLIIWGLGSVAILVIGYLIFKKLEKSFVEEL